MSSGSHLDKTKVNKDLNLLAPKFREQVLLAIEECKKKDLDAIIYEGYRSQELQQIYYRRGRSVIPPEKPVTYAKTNLYSWHGYGLAVDVISAKYHWEPPGGIEWFKSVADIFKSHQCKWGGDWKRKDPPHFQWHLCKPSPSDTARTLIRNMGVEHVWKIVGAM